MPLGSTGQSVIAKVVNKLGGIDAAAAQLAVSPSLLMRFVDGTLDVPDAILLKAVDYALEDLPQPPTAAPTDQTQQKEV